MSELIKISVEELADPTVDARIAEQQSFGFAPPSAPDVPQRLIFRPWFALMLAGLVAALLAWAIIEPWMDDGVRFVGQVREIRSNAPNVVAGLADLGLDIEGIYVRVLADAIVLGQDGSAIPLSNLAVGDVVEVLAPQAGQGESSTWALAQFLQQRPSSTPHGAIDLDALGTQNSIASFLLFPLTAALVGLFVGATDGLLSRAWARAAHSGAIGLVVGFFGGLLASFPADMIYSIGSALSQSVQSEDATRLTGGSLLLNIMGRGLAWAVVGFAAGMGLGIAARSRKLFFNGVIGGTVGALFGGILFDPINYALENVVRTGGAEVSRMIGIALIGAAAGVMIGVVELVSRESWVRILTGPIAGKEFILYRDPTWIGSSPKSEIFLFKDPQVAPRHASIHRVGEHYEIEDHGSPTGTIVSGGRVKRRRLKDRDRIHVGTTMLEFRLRDE